jgi:hypothetical protein
MSGWGRTGAWAGRSLRLPNVCVIPSGVDMDFWRPRP